MRVIFPLILLLSCLSAAAPASTREPDAGLPVPVDSPDGAQNRIPALQVEVAAAEDPGIFGLRVGLHVASEASSLGLGVGLLADEDLLMEVFFGLRRHLIPLRQQALVPFVGLGATVAFSSESTPAEDDDVDNDGDGAVDEDGEEDSEISDFFVAMTPELGCLVRPSPRVTLCPVARYYLKSTGIRTGQWVYALGVHFNF